MRIFGINIESQKKRELTQRRVDVEAEMRVQNLSNNNRDLRAKIHNLQEQLRKTTTRRSAVISGPSPVAGDLEWELAGIKKEKAPVFYKLTEENNIEIAKEFCNKGLFTDDLNDIHVSTVFLSIDHSMIGEKGSPVLFETLISAPSDSKLNDYQKRYTTYAQAYLGHKTIVRSIKKKYKDV